MLFQPIFIQTTDRKPHSLRWVCWFFNITDTNTFFPRASSQHLRDLLTSLNTLFLHIVQDILKNWSNHPLRCCGRDWALWAAPPSSTCKYSGLESKHTTAFCAGFLLFIYLHISRSCFLPGYQFVDASVSLCSILCRHATMLAHLAIVGCCRTPACYLRPTDVRHCCSSPSRVFVSALGKCTDVCLCMYNNFSRVDFDRLSNLADTMFKRGG